MLGPRSEGADLHKTEAKRTESIHRVALLIHPGGQADTVREAQPHHLYGIIHRFAADKTKKSQPFPHTQHGKRRLMHCLRGETEKNLLG